MGIATDVFFVEGLFESLKELGVAGTRMHTRDANGGGVIEPRGYVAMGQRVGATVAGVKTRIETGEDANDAGAFVWKEVPGGVVNTQIPYLWPFNAPNSWNLNVAKFKAHTMGLTLASKTGILLWARLPTRSLIVSRSGFFVGKEQTVAN